MFMQKTTTIHNSQARRHVQYNFKLSLSHPLNNRKAFYDAETPSDNIHQIVLADKTSFCTDILILRCRACCFVDLKLPKKKATRLKTQGCNNSLVSRLRQRGELKFH